MTVHQIHSALARDLAAYCEREDGSVQQICRARRQSGDLQVRLAGNKRWVSPVKRVWAVQSAAAALPEARSAAAASEAAPPALAEVVFYVQRRLAGEQSPGAIQNLALEGPLWMEAPGESTWMIFLRQTSRPRFVLKRWRETSPHLTAPTLSELASLMRLQEGLHQLLDRDEAAPFRGWRIATPVTQPPVVEASSTVSSL